MTTSRRGKSNESMAITYMYTHNRYEGDLENAVLLRLPYFTEQEEKGQSERVLEILCDLVFYVGMENPGAYGSGGRSVLC